MYGGKGGGNLVAGAVPTAAGVAVLPNTSGNETLLVLSIISTTVGILVLVSALTRIIINRTHKA